MKIVIATPLYPPDIAEPAPYAKDLACRLAKDHEVTAVLFGRLPEKVEGVSFITVDKRELLPVRLIRYFKALWHTTKDADILYLLDGASVELTVGLLSIVKQIPIIIHLGDEDANEWTSNKPILRLIKSFARSRADAEIKLLPPQRPEVLPYNPRPMSEFAAYEQTWKDHIQNLESLFADIKIK